MEATISAFPQTNEVMVQSFTDPLLSSSKVDVCLFCVSCNPKSNQNVFLCWKIPIMCMERANAENDIGIQHATITFFDDRNNKTRACARALIFI